MNIKNLIGKNIKVIDVVEDCEDVIVLFIKVEGDDRTFTISSKYDDSWLVLNELID